MVLLSLLALAALGVSKQGLSMSDYPDFILILSIRIRFR
jgi:hypothetical protein